mmetsp:Transcript_1396/g.1274  ORF Transcript_1396/g.1274 Transcript_1396/m.1274 type:complete len:91 (-) Transcript_1396:1926-2198(-)
MYMQKDKSFYDVHAPDSFQKEIKNIIWKNITPELFTLFWTLSLEHIYVPVERYDSEIEKINKEILTVEKSSDNQKKSKSKKEKELLKLKG